MADILAGITSILDPAILILMLVGVFMGIVVGAIPGLSVTMGVGIVASFLGGPCELHRADAAGALHCEVRPPVRTL